MKADDEVWVDYIAETFGEEVSTRVDLFFRAMVIKQLDSIDLLSESMGGHLSKLIRNKAGALRAPLDAYRSIVEYLAEPVEATMSESRALTLMCVDQIYGLVFEEFYQVLSEAEVEQTCRQFLSDQDIRATYALKASDELKGKFSDDA